MRDSAELLGKCLLGFPRGTGHKKYACRCRGRERQWAGSLGQEDPLEKETATHSSILAWEIPWTEVPGGLQSMGLQRIGPN